LSPRSSCAQRLSEALEEPGARLVDGVITEALVGHYRSVATDGSREG
jgi:hypothetical protein